MPATLLRAAADAAVSALPDMSDDCPARAFTSPFEAAETAVARASRQFEVLVCVRRAAFPERAISAPAIRSLPFGDEEDALTWEDAAWQ